MNLIITCARHLEPETIEELRKILADFGDENPVISKTTMSGILTGKTKLDAFEVVKNIREKIIEEPWSIRYCLRVIPIQKVVNTKLDEISNHILSLMKNVKEKDTYRITIKKRNSSISSMEMISKIAARIPNTVSLKNPDWIVLIEILGENTGLSVLTKNDIFSLEISKRKLLE